MTRKIGNVADYQGSIRYPEQARELRRLGVTASALRAALRDGGRKIDYTRAWRLTRGIYQLQPHELRALEQARPITARVLLERLRPEQPQQADLFGEEK